MKQQRVALQLMDTTRNRASAKAFAKALADLNLGKWDWSEWSVYSKSKTTGAKEAPTTWAGAIRASQEKGHAWAHQRIHLAGQLHGHIEVDAHGRGSYTPGPKDGSV